MDEICLIHTQLPQQPLQPYPQNQMQSTDTQDADIFYKVKKQILDKLDLILQKVNLEIINSMPFDPKGNGNGNGKGEGDDFTFIELSHFQGEIAALFGYLDKLYDELGESVSYGSGGGYGSKRGLGYGQGNGNMNSNKSIGNTSVNKATSPNDLPQKLSSLQLQLKTLQSQNTKLSTALTSTTQKLLQTQQKLSQHIKKSKKIRSKLSQLNNQIRHQPAQFGLARKFIVNKVKEFRFSMLEARVEILSRIKEFQEGNRERLREEQLYREREREREREKRKPEIVCHHISQNELEIINQLNQILKLC